MHEKQILVIVQYSHHWITAVVAKWELYSVYPIKCMHGCVCIVCPFYDFYHKTPGTNSPELGQLYAKWGWRIWLKSTLCGLVTPYGDRDLVQHWLRQWLAAWRHRSITRTNVDLSPTGSCGTTKIDSSWTYLLEIGGYEQIGNGHHREVEIGCHY